MTRMTDTALDPTTLPLQAPAPGSSVWHLTETLTTPLPQEVLWREFLRAVSDSRAAVLWPTSVSNIRTLSEPLQEGTVLESTLPTGVKLHYRIVRFSPPHLLQYACVQGHHLAGGATISLGHAEGVTTLSWRIEYSGFEPQFVGLERYCKAFFAGLAGQLRQLEASR
jgi:hypothetical protein